MSFTPEQIAALQAKLSGDAVSQREKAGRKLSYIEGWHAIAEANRIFGFDGWDRITALTQLGEPEIGEKNIRVRYMATVTIRVRAGGDVVERQGVGYGSGIAKDLGDAYEGAIKEAETDATKRALATFGWPFGLALYDKSGEHVDDGEPAQKAASRPVAASPAPPRPPKGFTAIRAEMASLRTPDALRKWKEANWADIEKLPESQFLDFKTEYQDIKAQLEGELLRAG